MIPISIAEKLLRLSRSEQMPASKMKHAITEELKAEGIIAERIQGRTKSALYIENKAAFQNYIYGRWGIADLAEYIKTIKDADTSRADLVAAGSDSKLAIRRSFKGFLVNSFVPVDCTLNGKAITIHPDSGTFQFIYDFEHFVPAADTVIVGMENAENFCTIEKQRYLFPNVKPLFVSRYPQGQSRDLVKWLQSIRNPYWHFGDFDFAGINIYHSEYKKHLGERAAFFIPEHIEQLLEQYGNGKLYDNQQLHFATTDEEAVNHLIGLIHKYKKGLEQEALIINK